MNISREYLFRSILIGGACLSLAQGLNNAVLRPNGSEDNQWGPSRALLEHRNPYEAYLNRGADSPFMMAQRPNYPASGLVLLAPYAALDWPAAKALWALSNVLFTALILWCLFQLLPAHTVATPKVVIATTFMMSTPWRNGVGLGQHALFTLSFFLLAVVMTVRRHHSAGAALAVSWFKYTIAFPLSLFFARSKRGWIIILAAAGIHAGLTMLAAFWIGTSALALLIQPLQVAQSATPQGYLDVFAVATALGVSSRLVPTLAALVIIGATYATIRRDADVLSSLSTLSLASMTVCFHLGYDLVVLVVPLTYALRARRIGVRAKYYLFVIGVFWFGDRLISIVVDRGLVSSVAGFSAFRFWFRVAVFYAALGADCLSAFRHGPAVSGPADSAARTAASP
jgi:hypothetical protein